MSGFDASRFDNGASYLVSDDAFKQYCNGAKCLGRPDQIDGNLFCAPRDEIDAAIANSNGDIHELEAKLGLDKGTLGDGPLHRVDINNPSEHNLRGATGKESGANCFFNTPRDENGNLPNVSFFQETNGKGESWTARDSTGREIIDADKSDPAEIAKLNGRYATNSGELAKDANGNNNPNGVIHDANLEGYQHTTSGGIYEGVTNQIPNTPDNISHSKIDGWGKGEAGHLSITSDTGAYARRFEDLDKRDLNNDNSSGQNSQLQQPSENGNTQNQQSGQSNQAQQPSESGNTQNQQSGQSNQTQQPSESGNTQNQQSNQTQSSADKNTPDTAQSKSSEGHNSANGGQTQGGQSAQSHPQGHDSGGSSGMSITAANTDQTATGTGKQNLSDGMSTKAADSSQSSGHNSSGGMSTTAAGQNTSAPSSSSDQSHGLGQSM